MGAFTFMGECFRSWFILYHAFKGIKKAPVFCFTVFLGIWIAYFGEMYAMVNTTWWWLPADPLVADYSDPWTAAILFLHWINPIGFLRQFWVSCIIVTMGYTYEKMIGTLAFMTTFLTMHVCTIALITYMGLADQAGFRSFEYTLPAMACMMHFENPLISTSGLGEEFLKLPYPFEPKWNVWILILMLINTTSSGDPYPLQVSRYMCGFFIGSITVLRYPSTWPEIKMYFKDTKRAEWIFHCGLYVAALMALPITTDIYTLEWQQYILTSRQATLFHKIFYEMPLPELLNIFAWTLSCLPLFTILYARGGDFRYWLPKFYAIMSLFILMYTMNLPFWASPNTGWVMLLYCVYGFANV